MDDSVYLDLSKSIESVIHSAASVKHYGDREQIYNVNISGTQNVIDFCILLFPRYIEPCTTYNCEVHLEIQIIVCKQTI